MTLILFWVLCEFFLPYLVKVEHIWSNGVRQIIMENAISKELPNKDIGYKVKFEFQVSNENKMKYQT